MQLVAQTGSDTGSTFKLTGPTTIVGRQPGVDILLNDSQVSRRHAQIDNRNGVFTVTDLGSANGTFLNNSRLPANAPQPLRPGDILRFGDTAMTVQPLAAPVPAPQPPVYNQPQPPAQNYAPQNYNAPQPPAVPNYAPQNYSQPQPPVQNYAPQNYNAPQPPPVQNYAPQNYNQPPAQNFAPQPPVSVAPAQPPAKKSNTGLIVGVIIGVVVLIGAVVGGIFALGSNKTSPTATAAPIAQNATPLPGDPTATPQPGKPLPTATPLPTIAVGNIGTNPPPPSPAPAQPTVAPTVRPPTATPAAAATPTRAATSGTANAYGVQAQFPSGWEVTTDDKSQTLYGDAPDNVTFFSVTRLSSSRESRAVLEGLLENLRKSYPDIKNTDISVEGDTAVVLTQYDDSTSKTTRRDLWLATLNPAKASYVFRLSSDTTKFDSQTDAFKQFLNSVKYI